MPPDKLCLIVCRHYEQEAEAILWTEDWTDVYVRTYPATCCRPDLTPAVLEQIAQIEREDAASVRLIGGCPISSLKLNPLPTRCEFPGLTSCFYRLAGRDLVDYHIRKGSYLLTPGWLSNWTSHLKEWEFDQATARDFFHECTSCLLLLDTGVDKHSEETLKAFADYLDLPYHIVPVGLDHFRLLLENVVQGWRMETVRQEAQEIVKRANRRLADHAMAFDFLAGLSRMLTEEEVIRQIMELFTMLLAPGHIVYASVVNDLVTGTYSSAFSPPDTRECQAWLDGKRDEYVWDEDRQGFYLRLVNQDRTLGLLEFSAIAFPANRQEYMNLTPPLATMCALALTNARLVQEVRQLANTDSLTGLSNRGHFFDLAKAEFAAASRYRRPLAAFLLDVDHFKKVNDSFGHAMGDRTLIQIAQCCRRVLRAADLCGRYGGEEFAFLIPETPLDNALQAAERLRQAIAVEDITLDGRTIRVTASIGIAMLDTDCPHIDALIDRSDQALYHAKESGRDRVCVYGQKESH